MTLKLVVVPILHFHVFIFAIFAADTEDEWTAREVNDLTAGSYSAEGETSPGIVLDRDSSGVDKRPVYADAGSRIDERIKKKCLRIPAAFRPERRLNRSLRRN
jgi:hypothetical protein